MPEGPEIRRSRDILFSLLVGLYILEINLSSRGLTWNLPLTTITEQKIIITDVSSHGKKIFFHLSNGGFLVTSYKMTGRWVLTKGKHTDMTMTMGVLLNENIRGDNTKPLLFLEKFTLYYEETRPFGGVCYLSSPVEYYSYLSQLGPDILSGQLTYDIFSNLLNDKRYQNWQICKLLMKQSIIAGIGNYLKAEILYQAKIRPDRLVSQLSVEERIILYNSIITITWNSYHNHGLTIKDFIAPDGQLGLYQPLVYGRTTDDQGQIVIKQKFKDGSQLTHWVPTVQR